MSKSKTAWQIAAQAAWIASQASGRKSRLIRRGGKWYVLNETAIK